LILFPNIPQKQILVNQTGQIAQEPQWAGKELLIADSGLNWEQFFPLKPIEAIWLEKLRQQFSPEIVVPVELTVHSPTERRLEAGLTNFLLDYDQELAVKSDLDLPSENDAITKNFQLNVINGVAGSGKTLILLFRLRLLYHLYPDKKFLVLTHNRPLINDMQGRFARLEGNLSENIEWHTFNSWCYQCWPKNQKWIDPLSMKERQQIIEETLQKYLPDSSMSATKLQGEIDWWKDQVHQERHDYLSADRRGRGFGLNLEQRQKMFKAIVGYQNTLKQRNERDWADVPRYLWQYIKDGKTKLPLYDFILIDEAQFFAAIWFEIVKKILNSQTGHLFIVADPTQGFLGRGTSWKSFGLEVRGHTYQLQQSYRTTQEIMQFATLLYRMRINAEKDDDIVAPDLLNMPKGAFPEIIPMTSQQDEIARVTNEVVDLVKKSCPKKHLLILHTNWQGVDKLIYAINEKLGNGAAIDPKETYPGDYIRVTTLNAGTGLESPIVFLAGVKQLFEEEQSLRLSDDERETLIRDNTRKLYMAATRAGQRLVITCAGKLPDILEQVIKAQSSL
jgi:superfamily I DNA/RNA helicase